ncbi:MAG: hypothetical protein CL859_11675 [Cyanobium sp. ARS6]|nr:hypothetical protein [Cyanobium sp. ARS6]
MRDVAFIQDPGKPGKSNPTVQTALENVVATIAWNYRYRQLQSRGIALTKSITTASPAIQQRRLFRVIASQY